MARKLGKKYKKLVDKVDSSKVYTLEEAIKLVKDLSYTSFTSSIDMHANIKLQKGQDPRSIKGAITLPNVIKQKDVKIAVCVPVDMKEKAQKAGADFYDFTEITKQIESGNIQFDTLLAVPQMMPELAKYGKELGPKGLMPNPKTGTVVNPNNLESVISEYKKGKTVIKVDKTGVLHVAVGNVKMEDEKIAENIRAIISFMQSLLGKSKEAIFKKVYLAPTMGPSVQVNIRSI